jgi:thymidylate kinase
MMRLLAHVLDYGLGYWFVIHPLLVRSGLVIFDRYYDDVGIDPKRYRYGGPLWLHRLLAVAVPKPHVRLVLDAPEEVILSRKQEVELQEIRNLRRLYSEYQQSHRDCRFVDSTSSIAAVAAESTRAIVDVLTARAQRQYARWLPAKRINQ